MIQVQTRFLGVVECPEESVITFPAAIPPFPDQMYVVIAKEGSPYFFLQSVTTPDLCFITLPVQTLDPNYRLALEPRDVEMLGLPSPESQRDLTRLTILTIPERGAMTANLAAPIIINPSRQVGVQAVRSDGVYSHAHPIGAGVEG
ncbi:MAG TPA: flagellar assembly protein FliW [Bryobacteraceae bacterium]|jgi:flagellar assembly factor FliW|nr:flagellar assembly protein FliW [Bryobacteraceae bacterium]